VYTVDGAGFAPTAILAGEKDTVLVEPIQESKPEDRRHVREFALNKIESQKDKVLMKYFITFTEY
jgi:hypothetical protein